MSSLRDFSINQCLDYKNNLKISPGVITTGSGNPIGVKDAVQTIGPNGPILMSDFHFIDNVTHFVSERIPERVVNAKGGGAFGYFELTHDVSKYCAAKLFEKVKKRTPIAVRFSTVSGERGSADTVRDPRGFALKFYTEDGIWDLVGANTPVHFIRDPALFPSLTHVMKRNPQTNVRDPEMFWDFMTLRPETTHQLALMFSDRGTPDGFRHMNGYSGHAYKLINGKGEPIFAKFYLKTDQGKKNLDPRKAEELAGTDPDYAIKDLFNSIKSGSYPSWTVYLQVMTYDEAKKFKFNAFDVTKLWPKKDFPIIQFGKIVLDRNPTNYFAEIESLAFNPANMIPGIETSPDKMLQARLMAYTIAQAHRLGPNHMQIPVNCPYHVKVLGYNRDSGMTVNDNQDGAPNYFPNSFSGPEESPRARALQPCCPTEGEVYRFSSGDTEDNYSQVTDYWVFDLDDAARKRLIINIALHLFRVSQFIQDRAVRNFTLVHADFGRLLTEALITTKDVNTKFI